MRPAGPGAQAPQHVGRVGGRAPPHVFGVCRWVGLTGVAAPSRCCQNGLVSVWTVPQDVADFPESSFSDPEEWWEGEAKPKFMVISTLEVWRCVEADVRAEGSPAVFQASQCAPDGAVCAFQLKGHITPVRALAFSPDGLALVSGGVGGLMNVWSLRVRSTDAAATSGQMTLTPPPAVWDRTAPSCRPWSLAQEPFRTWCGSQMWVWLSAPTDQRSVWLLELLVPYFLDYTSCFCS